MFHLASAPPEQLFGLVYSLNYAI